MQATFEEHLSFSNNLINSSPNKVCTFAVFPTLISRVFPNVNKLFFNIFIFRSFPGLFQREARGKKRFSQKTLTVNFLLLDEQRSKTPEGHEELQLMQAGLGKRTGHHCASIFSY